MEKPNSHCVVFRTGGTSNFQWKRSSAMSYSDAQQSYKDTTLAGHHCFVEKYDLSVKIGLPDNYSYECNGRG